MSRAESPTDTPLLAAASYFWSFDLNAFVFKSSMKTITLYDLVVLFALAPIAKRLI